MTDLPSKNISNVLKYIQKNKDNFVFANDFLSKNILKNKIEKSVIEKSKKKQIYSNLSSSEKLRYGKIGASFIKGTQSFFEDFILKVKKDEQRKNLYILDKIKISKNDDEEKKEQSIFKNKKKKAKGGVALKWGLIAVTMGASVYFIKELYELFITNHHVVKIKEILSSYIPKSLKFYAGTNKIIDGYPASFVLTMMDGDEIALSRKIRGTNPIEEAAKTFDYIIKKTFLEDGFGNFINNIEDKDKSPIGYLIFKPFSHYINITKRFLIDAFENPRIGKTWRDHYYLVSWLADFVTDKLKHDIKSRYTPLMLKSQDKFTNIMAGIQNKYRVMLGDSVVNTNDPNYATLALKNVSINVNGKDNNVYITMKNQRGVENYLTQFIKSNNPQDIVKLIEETNDTKMTFNWNHARNGSGVASLSFSTTGKLAKILGINIHTNLRTVHIRSDEEFENFKNNLTKIANDELARIGDVMKEIVEEAKKARAYYLYNETFLKHRDTLMGLMASDVDLLKSDSDKDYMESRIYFDNSMSTYEKMSLIVETYFDPKVKEKNFFLRYIKNMERSFEEMETNVTVSFNKFKYTLDPFAHLVESSKKFDLKDTYLDFLINNFKGSNTTILAESSDGGFDTGMSEMFYMKKLITFSIAKKNLRRRKSEIFNNIKKRCFKIMQEKCIKEFTMGTNKKIGGGYETQIDEKNEGKFKLKAVGDDPFTAETLEDYMMKKK